MSTLGDIDANGVGDLAAGTGNGDYVYVYRLDLADLENPPDSALADTQHIGTLSSLFGAAVD
jgi:hypothetical protein